MIAQRCGSVLALALSVAVGTRVGARPADAVPVAPIPSKEERHRVLGLDGRGAPRPDARRAQYAGSQDAFDVTHYLIDIDFDNQALSIAGRVTVTATSLVEDLTFVELDLRDNMTVTGVTAGLAPLPFTHADDRVGVTLPGAFDAGQSFSFTVFYGGSPVSTGFGAFGWNKYGSGGSQGQMVWSLSEPDGARNWWPCKDRPDDKALVEEWWTVRSTWIATGNGVLLGVDDVPGSRKRYRWRPTHPLTTYLVSVAATNYVSFSHTYTPIEGGSMPIDYYVYPEDLADAQVSFSGTAAMIELFAETFGEYPFVADKYGMSAFPFGGAMEHSTNTSYGYQLINGAHTYDFVNAHEIAHQWWGDSVSPETWDDIWLNEGFASYGEALWFEHVGGETAYHSHMAGMYQDEYPGSVYAPQFLFGPTVYDKGAWVLHMLRRVMGDEAFFLALREWYASRADGVGNTAQFQANQESLYGGPLDWFFDPWVYGVGMPAYQYGFTTADLGGGIFRNYVTIRQTQTGPGTFAMPVELTFVTASGTDVRTVWNDQAEQHYVLDTAALPLELQFDEEFWILRSALTTFAPEDSDTDGVPDHADNCVAAANPAQSDLDGDLAGDACDPDDDGDALPDAADCAPADVAQGVPGEVTDLSHDGTALVWTAAPRADVHDLSRGLLSGLAAGYGDCLVPGLVTPTYVDADLPPPGDGFQYLVRGVDLGCGGAGPLGQDSAGNPRPSPCP
jgi:hypothetical protein